MRKSRIRDQVYRHSTVQYSRPLTIPNLGFTNILGVGLSFRVLCHKEKNRPSHTLWLWGSSLMSQVVPSQRLGFPASSPASATLQESRWCGKTAQLYPWLLKGPQPSPLASWSIKGGLNGILLIHSLSYLLTYLLSESDSHSVVSNSLQSHGLL